MSQKIYKHVTVIFDRRYLDKIDKKGYEKKEKEMFDMFKTIPMIKYSTGSIVWTNGNDPKMFCADVPHETFEQTIDFVEQSELYRNCVKINFSFYDKKQLKYL